MSSDDVLEFVAMRAGASEVRRAERIQSLWAGYGELFRVVLDDDRSRTAIVKEVRPPPRVSTDAVSHQRKLRSYQVEVAFYQRYAARCSEACRVPALLGAQEAAGCSWLVLEDLDAAGFSGRRRRCNADELKACLAWLAAFHATFLGTEPEGLWPVGTYWHLATRLDELRVIEDEALREAAPRIDAALNACRYKTLVHGDAKEANFCFGATSVAAVDFQYVGGGAGIKDVAYLLGNGSAEHAGLSEAACLEHYFACLNGALAHAAKTAPGEALENEWRALYPLACADFERFLAGWGRSG